MSAAPDLEAEDEAAAFLAHLFTGAGGRFALVSRATGRRIEYRLVRRPGLGATVRQRNPRRALGIVGPEGFRASASARDTVEAKAIGWFWARLSAGRIPDEVEALPIHEGGGERRYRRRGPAAQRVA